MEKIERERDQSDKGRATRVQGEGRGSRRREVRRGEDERGSLHCRGERRLPLVALNWRRNLANEGGRKWACGRTKMERKHERDRESILARDESKHYIQESRPTFFTFVFSVLLIFDLFSSSCKR